MDHKFAVDSGLKRTYELLDQYPVPEGHTEPPLLLVVKGAVLEVLQSGRGSKNKLKRIIKSTELDEILGALVTDKQKEDFLHKFRNNPESSFLNIAGRSGNGEIFFDDAIKSDAYNSLIPSRAASYNLGIVLLQKGKVIEAIKYFTSSIAYFEGDSDLNLADSFFSKVNLYLGNCYLHLGKTEEAIPYFLNSIKNGVEDDILYEAYRNLWYSYSSIGNKKAANITFTEVSKIFPDFPSDLAVLYHKGMMFYREHNYSEAVKVLEPLFPLVENNDEAYNLYIILGESYTKLGHYGNADFYLSKCLSLSNGCDTSHIEKLMELNEKSNKALWEVLRTLI